MTSRFAGISLCAIGCLITSPLNAAPKSKAHEFFEKKVRPILIKRCFDCHSGDSVESKLHLGSLAGMLTGGLRGPAIVPGKPDKSLLVLSIRHNEELKMPPKSKLPRRERAILIEWVKQGAVWPNAKPVVRKVGKKKAGPLFTAEERRFWAFQRPRQPAVPSVRNAAWVQSPIDNFVLALLDKNGLSPARLADKRTLIRRATFDLIGLPPKPEEVAAFLADDSPNAFAKVVERLLASPHYGERWGRHWLDVARYADSNGLDENLSYANAWRYRDYVIAAFNADKPYDRFVREQIAGDLLPGTVNASDGLVATGFLTLGPKMLAEDDPRKMQMDIIDEQIDTIGKAFLGLWLGCARCHDHKFDPIPTEDYYALAGIFKSTRTMENFKVVAKWQERRLVTPMVAQRIREFEQRLAKQKAEIDALRSHAAQRVVSEAQKHVDRYLLAAAYRMHVDAILKDAKSIGKTLSKTRDPKVLLLEAESFVRGNISRDSSRYGRGIGVILSRGTPKDYAEYDLTIKKAGYYRVEFRYAAAGTRPVKLSINNTVINPIAGGRVTGSWYPDTQRWELQGFYKLKSGKNTIRLERSGPFPHIDKLLFAPLDREKSQLLAKVKTVPGTGYQPKPVFVRQWVNYLKRTKTDPQSLLKLWHQIKNRRESTPRALAFRKALRDPKGPFAIPQDVEGAFPMETLAQLRELRADLTALQKKKPKPPVVMAVSDDNPEDLRVHIRGSYLTLGSVVPRRFPRILAGTKQAAITGKQSGRLQLAKWLTERNHPLTSRVMVNRLWRWHFGAGIVRTPDNFGRLGERPTNQALLDWLSIEFEKRRWSIKAMHRLIMLSSTYQMSTAFNERAAKVDPDNRLLWRMNRRRLEAETLRDSMLALSGQLEQKMRGSLLTVKNRAYVTSTGSNLKADTYASTRRSVYLPVIRSALYSVFQTFDFSDPSAPSGNRVATTVAPQALLLMNSDLVAKRSRQLANRLLNRKSLSDAQRLQVLYELVYSRPPTSGEVAQLRAFLAAYERKARAETNKGDAPRLRAWQALCRVLFASHEFVYVE